MDTVPGDLLGTTQDYKAGANTFVDQEEIFSLVAGNTKVNEKADVMPVTRTPRLLQKGDVVYGRAEDFIGPVIMLTLERTAGYAIGDPTAFIHVSNIKDGYVENANDEIKIGDIIKAKVLEIKTHGIYLTTKERELGVISAYCARCRGTMYILSGALICRKCRHKEYRKLGYPYKVI